MFTRTHFKNLYFELYSNDAQYITESIEPFIPNRHCAGTQLLEEDRLGQEQFRRLDAETQDFRGRFHRLQPQDTGSSRHQFRFQFRFGTQLQESNPSHVEGETATEIESHEFRAASCRDPHLIHR